VKLEDAATLGRFRWMGAIDAVEHPDEPDAERDSPPMSFRPKADLTINDQSHTER
jgi:hypothetical protein